ncbi:RILP-like protein 1 [Xenopus laevis]|uniref:RILP-like protein 1 n=1 Tax=Xenopus laevis TaxID=8355 RepID=A0A8J1M780_XENLA|nr:RILP-like protein 1 [Xenopus laevis]
MGEEPGVRVGAGCYLQEQLLEAQKKEHVLQNQLSQLTEENQKLLGQLAEHKSQEDCAVREERDLMLQLKKVVDMQRDQIRTLTHETRQKNKDTEVVRDNSYVLHASMTGIETFTFLLFMI